MDFTNVINSAGVTNIFNFFHRLFQMTEAEKLSVPADQNNVRHETEAGNNSGIYYFVRPHVKKRFKYKNDVSWLRWKTW